MKGVVAALLVALVAVTADECPSDWSQEQLLVHADCNKFYKCTYGYPVEMDCWGDLFFNIDTWQCDWPANVDCADRNIPGQTLTTTTTAEPTTPEPTTEEPTTAEPTTPEPTTEEPTTAEPTTPEPTTEEPTTAEPTTPEPTTEEPTTAEPTTPEATTVEPTTTQEPTTTEEPTTTTTAKPTTTEEPTTAEPTTTAAASPSTEAPTSPAPEFLENGCPVDPHVHWLLPVEGDCNAFYYCVWGELVLTACPASLHFNRNIQVCDWPENAGCLGQAN